MFDSILVVCTGNICRSPIGERILRKAFPSKVINSAGIGALVDHPADNSAIKVAERYNLSLEGHKGVQFTSKLARQYDLILVMEKRHLQEASNLSPESRGKIMLLGHWLDNKEIPDPYRKSDEAFNSVYQMINHACHKWAEKLR